MKDLADKYGISSAYGPRSGGFHYGIDIPTPMRSPLYAPEDGVIAFEGDIPAPVAGYPKDRIIILQLPNSFIVFAHLDETVINTGQRVKRGQLIGYTGNSGYSTGPHLHAEEHQGVKAANRGFLAYPSIDITPRFRGSAQGGATDDMTIIIRPIAMLKVHVHKQLTLYNLETGKPITGSGSYMELTGKSNIVRGASYLIPVDRMNNQEPFGFLEHEVMDQQNQIHDTQFDPLPIKEVIKEVPVEVVKEIIKEVPVEKEVIKEVVKEIPVEVIKEVEVIREVKVPADSLSGIELIRLGLRKWLGIGGGD